LGASRNAFPESARRNVAAIALASIRATGSPGSGSAITGTPSLMSISSPAISSARSGAALGVKPRICKLPRALTSMMPLPWRCAA
jgi:hypothetical protein